MLAAIALLALATGCAAPPQIDSDGWIALFDGRSLAGWKVTEFGSQGKVAVKNRAIVLRPGNPFTGVTLNSVDFPKTDYEVEVRGSRVTGGDFFCALTFPVGDSHCTLVLGGWGGRLVGLSSLDDMDASENETTRFIDFVNGRDYVIRVRVTSTRITAWLDDSKLVDQGIDDRTVAVRWELEPSRPLGIASFETEAAFTRLRYRSLK